MTKRQINRIFNENDPHTAKMRGVRVCVGNPSKFYNKKSVKTVHKPIKGSKGTYYLIDGEYVPCEAYTGDYRDVEGTVRNFQPNFGNIFREIVGFRDGLEKFFGINFGEKP